MVWKTQTNCKTIKSEAKRLYNELIKKTKAERLERQKSNRFEKYILNILNNVGSVFTGAYLHYKNVPKKQCLKEVLHREQN